MRRVVRWDYFELADVQQRPCVCFCARCRNEIYRYDMVADVNGGLVHEECLDDHSTPVWPAISYFEGAC